MFRAGSVVEIVSVSSPLFPSVFGEAHYYFSQNSLFHKCFNGRKWHNGDSYPYSPVFLGEKPKSSRDVSLKLPPNTRSRFQLLDVIILLFSTSFLVFGSNSHARTKIGPLGVVWELKKIGRKESTLVPMLRSIGQGNRKISHKLISISIRNFYF